MAVCRSSRCIVIRCSTVKSRVRAPTFQHIPPLLHAPLRVVGVRDTDTHTQTHHYRTQNKLQTVVRTNITTSWLSNPIKHHVYTDLRLIRSNDLPILAETLPVPQSMCGTESLPYNHTHNCPSKIQSVSKDDHQIYHSVLDPTTITSLRPFSQHA